MRMNRSEGSPCEYNDSVSGGKPKLLQSFLGLADLFTFGHNVEEDRSMPRS